MILEEINIEQGSPEWLSLRKNKIGSSDASVIMEKSKWTTPFQLWCEKLDLAPNKEENDAMRRGKFLEPIAREEFERKTGIGVTPKVFVKDFMIASMDGVDLENKTAVEIKCPGKIDHEMAMDGVIPEHYYPQLQHQMLVMGIPMMYYFSYSESSSKVIEVANDKNYSIELFDKESKFWKNLQNLETPQLVDRDYVERSDTEWFQKAQEWHRISRQLKALEKAEEKLRLDLIQLAEGKNCRGAGIKISSSLRKGSVDYSSIPDLKNVDLDKYRKPKTTVWRLGEI